MLRKILFILFFIFYINNCLSQYLVNLEYIDNRFIADSLYKSQKYENALPFYIKIVESDFHRRLDYMYIAKCFYETNNYQDAKKYLQLAVEKGAHFNSIEDTIYCYDTTSYTVLNYLAIKEFENYRSQLIENTKSYFSNNEINELLSKELILRIELEQKLLEIKTKYPEIDSIEIQLNNIKIENQIALNSEIEKNGFPTIKTVGEKAVYAAFTIVQHSDHNVIFQEKCLELMLEEYKNGEIPAVCIAYLQDRILINKGEKQIFGTQTVEKKNKIIRKLTIDSELIEKRRTVMMLNKPNLYLTDFVNM